MRSQIGVIGRKIDFDAKYPGERNNNMADHVSISRQEDMIGKRFHKLIANYNIPGIGREKYGFYKNLHKLAEYRLLPPTENPCEKKS